VNLAGSKLEKRKDMCGALNESEDAVSSLGSNLNTCRWILEDNIEGPIVATFIGVEFVLSLIFNLFIVGHTLHNHRSRKNLRKSSIFLLFVLAVTNLMFTVVYLPFTVVASGSREWIFGRTDLERHVVCQINGFVLIYFSIAAVHTLAVISIDRCLSIEKPALHRRFMTWKVALSILILLWVRMVKGSVLPSMYI